MKEKNIWEIWKSDEMHPGGKDTTLNMLNTAGLPPKALIADIGCGVGAGVAFLEEKGFDALGVDISPILVETAQSRYGVKVILADALTLPFTDEALDGLLFECSFSQVSDPNKMLMECARVLKQEGVLMISDIYNKGEQEQEKSNWEKRLKEAGFTLVCWRDWPEILERFVSRALWELGDGELVKLLCRNGCLTTTGYFTMVARLDDKGS